MAEHKVTKVHATVSGAGSGEDANVSAAEAQVLFNAPDVNVSAMELIVLWSLDVPAEEEQEAPEEPEAAPFPYPSNCEVWEDNGFMTEIALEIVNCALLNAGANPIASFDENSTEAKYARQCYMGTVLEALGNYRWRFAAKEAILNKLLDEPLAEYEEAYQIPTDLVLINSLFYEDGRRPIAEFDRMQDTIQVNFRTDQNLVLEYTFAAPERLWPPYFKALVEDRLSYMYAAQITRVPELVKLFKDEKEETWRLAKKLDADSQTTRRIPNSKLTAVRN